MTCFECKYLKSVGCDLIRHYCEKIDLIIPEPARMFCDEAIKEAVANE